MGIFGIKKNGDGPKFRVADGKLITPEEYGFLSVSISINGASESFEYLFIKNVCSEDELRLCKNELEILSFGLETPEKTGSAKDENGKLRKENKGFKMDVLIPPNG